MQTSDAMDGQVNGEKVRMRRFNTRLLTKGALDTFSMQTSSTPFFGRGGGGTGPIESNASRRTLTGLKRKMLK